MNTYRVGNNQNPSTIDIEIVRNEVGVSQTLHAKKKKGGSDPRFKRIINQNEKRENEEDPSKNKHLEMSNDQENDGTVKDKVISLLKPPKDFCLYAKASTKKFGDTPENDSLDFTEWVTKDTGYQPSDIQNDNENLLSKKRGNNCKNCSRDKTNIKTGLKKSASDCTFHVKNVYADENEDLQMTTSCTNSSKTFKPDKRRSVITVIGQTQTKPFNEVIREINQRRKLVKELDRHALCEAILESNENQVEVKNLIAQVDFCSPDGKVIYSTEKVYRCKDRYEDTGLCHARRRETSEDHYKKSREMIPERDSSINQADKKSRPKRFSKKLMTPAKEKTQLKVGCRQTFKEEAIRLSESIKCYLCISAPCIYNLGAYHSEKVTHLTRKLFLAFFMIVLFFVSLFMYSDIVKPLYAFYSFHGQFSQQTTPWYEKLRF